MSESGDRRPRLPSGLALAMDLGLRLAFSVLMGVGAGLLMDNWLATAPLFTLIGTVLGVAAAFYLMWQLAQASMNRQGRG